MNYSSPLTSSHSGGQAQVGANPSSKHPLRETCWRQDGFRRKPLSFLVSLCVDFGSAVISEDAHVLSKQSQQSKSSLGSSACTSRGWEWASPTVCTAEENSNMKVFKTITDPDYGISLVRKMWSVKNIAGGEQRLQEMQATISRV